MVVLHRVEANEFKISVQSLVHNKFHFVFRIIQNSKKINSTGLSSNHCFHKLWISASEISGTNPQEFGQIVHVESAIMGAYYQPHALFLLFVVQE